MFIVCLVVGRVQRIVIVDDDEYGRLDSVVHGRDEYRVHLFVHRMAGQIEQQPLDFVRRALVEATCHNRSIVFAFYKKSNKSANK